MGTIPNHFMDIEAMAAQPSPARARHCLAVLRRRWWLLMLAVVLAIGGALVYLEARRPRYVSKAQMWVRGRLHLADVGQYTEDLQNFFGTQIELMQSDKMRERALSRLKSADPEFDPPKDKEGRSITPLIRITQTPKSTVFLLESRGTNGLYARAFLDALMDEFLAYKKEVRSATSGDALASVSEQVYKQERELKLEQDKLNQFQRENNVALLREQVTGGGAHLAQLNAQLSLLKLELGLLDAAALEHGAGSQIRTNLFAAAPDPRRLTDSSSPVATLPVDFVTANQQVQALKIQREQMGRYLRPKHPKVVKLDEEITRGEKLIEFFRVESQEQIATAKAAMKLRIRSLEATIEELEGRVGEANRRLADFELIKAGIQRQQSFYDRLLMLLQGVDINSNLDQENVTILERADPPQPAGLPPLVVLTAAAVIGGFLGLGLICLIARVDDRCESLEELRDYLEVSVLGQVPEVKSKSEKGLPPLLEFEDSRHVFAESCRSLRSSLLYGANGSQRPRVLLVTSAAPNEGKSTIAVNLARTLAFGGARVLLIDGDLRSGRLHELFRVPSEPGLAEVLKRLDDPGRLVLSTPLRNLRFIPRGKVTQAGSELFMTPTFGAFLEDTRREFDYVILDSLPIFVADDTTTLAPQMEGVILVVRRSHTRAGLARQALDALHQRQAKVLGLVFNRAATASGTYRECRTPRRQTGTGGSRSDMLTCVPPEGWG
jgi:capsular exopolysaccharide synthesis family protein